MSVCSPRFAISPRPEGCTFAEIPRAERTEREQPAGKENEMTLREIADLLDARVLVGENHLDIEVQTAFAADLMSDVLAFAKPGSIMITGLTNPQIVRIASIVDNSAILLVRGKIPPEDTLHLAEELEIPVLSTRYILFETSGRLYANGIVGCVRKIEGPESVVPL